VAFSPDGSRVIAGSADEAVRLWDADTGKPIGKPLIGHTGPVWSAAFSPDGHRIAAGSNDKTVRVWDADTGQPIGQPMTGHTEAVKRVAYSPDRNTIASGGYDQTVRLWHTYPDPASTMCQKLSTNMSHKQWRDWISPDIDYIKVCPDLPVAPD
jgi:WD40 repeat protein